MIGSRKNRAQTGFTLLLAALVMSVVLSLGSAIFQIARKQILLSGTGRDSQFAFYAADTAAECALYWDFRFAYFAATTPAGVNPTCDGLALKFEAHPRNNESYTYTSMSDPINFFIGVTPDGYCAQVFVDKAVDETGVVRTTIRADGYSVHCSVIQTAPRALQRSIKLEY